MAKGRERGTTPVRRNSSNTAKSSKAKSSNARNSTTRSSTANPTKRKPGGSKPHSAHGRATHGNRATHSNRAKRQAGNIGGDQVEGRQSVRELLLAGKREVREIFLVAGQDTAPILNDIIDLADEAKIPIRQVSRSRFETISRTEAPQGVVALAAPLRPVSLEDLVAGSKKTTANSAIANSSSTNSEAKPFIVVVDSVVDPHNLGALMRSAESAGVTGFVFSRHRSPKISPTVTKVAAGAVEHLSIAQANGIAGALRDFTKMGIWNVGLDSAADTPIWKMNLADEPLALVLGSEGKGLSRLVRESCDLLVTIPLSGVIASLNVSAAGAIACFEVKRQREY